MQVEFDAVIVPGGGVDADGRPHPFVCARLDAALLVEPKPRWFIVLSRGTTHRPPPLDEKSFPVDEASASAQYLIERGVDHTMILKDTWSLDTIGNVYFCRYMITDQMGLKKLLIITSDFHIDRSKILFDWIYNMNRLPRLQLSYRSVPSTNLMAQDTLEARIEKETASCVSLREKAKNLDTPDKLAKFLFVDHGAYKSAPKTSTPTGASSAAPDPLLKSY